MTLQSGPDQECRVERFKTVCRWRRTEESLRVDERRYHGVSLTMEIDDAKAGTIGDEVRDDIIVFFRLARAGRIHETSTGAHDVGGAHQQRQLITSERRQITFMPSPPDIRVPSHG